MLGQGAEAPITTAGQRSLGKKLSQCLSADVPSRLDSGLGKPLRWTSDIPWHPGGTQRCHSVSLAGPVYSPPLLAEQSAKKTIELHKNPSWKPQRHP